MSSAATRVLKLQPEVNQPDRPHRLGHDAPLNLDLAPSFDKLEARHFVLEASDRCLQRVGLALLPAADQAVLPRELRLVALGRLGRNGRVEELVVRGWILAHCGWDEMAGTWCVMGGTQRWGRFARRTPRTLRNRLLFNSELGIKIQCRR